MPFLLPPPEFKPGELSDMGLTGTCELQICRSAGPWSLGTPERIEHSIQNAYLKGELINVSVPQILVDHHYSYSDVGTFRVHRESVLYYIVCSFWSTAGISADFPSHPSRTVVSEVKIENHIGDALVDRIIRAHREGTPWKCCLVLPLLPGFAFPIDHSDASAVRTIGYPTQLTLTQMEHRFVSSWNAKIRHFVAAHIPFLRGSEKRGLMCVHDFYAKDDCADRCNYL